MDIQVIKERREPLEFECAGETVKGEVFAYKVTPDYMAQLRTLSRKKDSAGKVQNSDAQMINELIPTWDVMNGGEPFPPTLENLMSAPLILLAHGAMGVLNQVGKLSLQSE